MRTLWAGTLPLMLVAAAPVTTSPSNPITMERFFYYSGVSTQFTRPVMLQKQVGST